MFSRTPEFQSPSENEEAPSPLSRVASLLFLLALACAPILGGTPNLFESDTSLGALRLLIFLSFLLSPLRSVNPMTKVAQTGLWFTVAWAALSLLVHTRFLTAPILLFAQVPALLNLLAVVLAFILTARTDAPGRARLASALIVGLAIQTLMVAYQYGQAKQQGMDWFRATGLFFSANFSAGYMALLLPLATALCLQASHRLAALGFGLAAALAFGGLIASGSRVGLVAGLLGLLITLVVANPLAPAKRASLPRLCALFLACLVLGFGFKGALTSRAVKTGGLPAAQRSSPLVDDFRLYTWRGTLKMALNNPVLGTGPGTFRVIYPRYAEVKFTGHAHHSYLQVAAECGLPALLGLLVALAVTLFRWPKTLVEGALLGGVCAALLRSFFDSEWVVLGNALPFWVVLGLLTPVATTNTPITPLRRWAEVGSAALGLVVALLALMEIYPPQPRDLAKAGKLAEAAQMEPTPRWYYWIARQAEEKGEWNKVVEAFEKAHQTDPTDLQTLRDLAESKEKRGDTDGARQTWQELIRVGEGPAGKYRAIPEVVELPTAYAYGALGDWNKCADIIVAHSYTDPIYQLQAYNVLDNNLEKARTRHAELVALFETAMSHLPERQAERDATRARLEKFFP